MTVAVALNRTYNFKQVYQQYMICLVSLQYAPNFKHFLFKLAFSLRLKKLFQISNEIPKLNKNYILFMRLSI